MKRRGLAWAVLPWLCCAALAPLARASNAPTPDVQSAAVNYSLPTPNFVNLRWTNASFGSQINDAGQTWGLCDETKVMVGLQCSGDSCKYFELVCAELRTLQNVTILWDHSALPNTNDSIPNVSPPVMFGDNTGSVADPTANTVVPSFDVNTQEYFTAGFFCTRKECGLLGQYPAPPLTTQNTSNYMFQFGLPSADPPPDDDSANMANSSACAWTDPLSSLGDGQPATTMLCPPDKIVAGMSCSGNHCSSVRLYCCPMQQAEPADCVYTPFRNRTTCQRVMQTYTTCNANSGIQYVTRDIVTQGISGGAPCDQTLLGTPVSCNPCAVGLAAQLQTYYSVFNVSQIVNATLAENLVTGCACDWSASAEASDACLSQCLLQAGSSG